MISTIETEIEKIIEVAEKNTDLDISILLYIHKKIDKANNSAETSKKLIR